MNRMTTAVAAVAVSIFAAGAAGAQGTVTVYCGVDENWCRGMVTAFTKATGIKTEMTRQSAGEIYARLRADRVKTPEPGEALTNLISLVRFATGQQGELAPFPELARQKFQTWLTQQETAAGKPFAPEQRAFLALIAEEIGANAALETKDLDHGTLKSRGGLPRALALFGRDRLSMLLDELNEAIAA